MEYHEMQLNLLTMTGAGQLSPDILKALQGVTCTHHHRVYTDSFDEKDAEFDVAIVEVSSVIPGGLKTATALKKRRPQAEVIVIYHGEARDISRVAHTNGMHCQFIRDNTTAADLLALSELIRGFQKVPAVA